MLRSRTPVVAAVVVALVFGLSAPSHSRAPQEPIPERIADTTFWRMVTTFSEPSGYFPSENFVSNENEWQFVIPGALRRIGVADAYLGVGPEQNFTYIAALKPRIAFICDIRRQNLIQHLLYKALFEMSQDRLDFLSRLWSRPQPTWIGTSPAPAEIVAGFRGVKPDSEFFALNMTTIFDRLVGRHGFALSSADSATLRAVYRVFFDYGPEISYSSRSGMAYAGQLPRVPINPASYYSFAIVRGAAPGGGSTTWRIAPDSTGKLVAMRDSSGTWVRDTTYAPMSGVSVSPLMTGGGPMYTTFGPTGGYATFGSLMAEDDGTGVNRGWLASEDAFQWLRAFQLRNLIVPVVGNFGGPKALRAVGQYLAEHRSRVSAFYTSNVEQYLFQDRIQGIFYDNVAALPTDTTSIFIRSFPGSFRAAVAPRRPGSRLAQSMSSIDAVVRAWRDGTIPTYNDLARFQIP